MINNQTFQANAPCYINTFSKSLYHSVAACRIEVRVQAYAVIWSQHGVVIISAAAVDGAAAVTDNCRCGLEQQWSRPSHGCLARRHLQHFAQLPCSGCGSERIQGDLMYLNTGSIDFYRCFVLHVTCISLFVDFIRVKLYSCFKLLIGTCVGFLLMTSPSDAVAVKAFVQVLTGLGTNYWNVCSQIWRWIATIWFFLDHTFLFYRCSSEKHRGWKLNAEVFTAFVEIRRWLWPTGVERRASAPD